MKFFNRIIPALAALLIFILLEQMLKTPEQLIWLVALTLAVTVLSVWQLADQGFKDKKFWWLLTTPFFLLLGGISFLSFLEGVFLKHFFFLILVVLIWSFLEVVFLRFHFRPKYQAYSLENISTHLNLITVFLTASSLFSFVIFLGLFWWLAIGVFIVIVLLLAHQSIETDSFAGWPYVLVITLLTTEIFWAVIFLPTSVYVNGIIVTIGYYLITGLIRNWLLEIRGKKVVFRYLLISVICLIIILVTAKWF